MERITITWENMEDFSAVPMGYRFIDYAEVVPGREAWGRKLVSSQEWFFKVHFPGNPIMPGVLVMETLQQTGLLIITSLRDVDEKVMFFNGCEHMRMYHSVRPGDTLSTHVVLGDFRRGIATFSGEVRIKRADKEKEFLACSMRFTMLLKSQMISMEPQRLEETPHIDRGETVRKPEMM